MTVSGAQYSSKAARARNRFLFREIRLEPYAMPRPNPARHLPFFALLLWGPALLGTLRADLPASSAASVPPVRDIVEKAVARDDFRRVRRTAFEADEAILTERLDPDGKVLSSKTVHVVHHPTADISFSSNMESKSAPASGQPDADTVKAQHIMAVMNLGKLAPHFIETIVGSAMLQGRDCYVIRYRPKPDQPAATREEKVVNGVSGRFWIAKDNYDILRSEGSLTGPVTVAFIASVTRMDFKFESLQLPNGDVGPANFSVDMAIKAPFYDFRQLQVNTLTNWRPRH